MEDTITANATRCCQK